MAPSLNLSRYVPRLLTPAHQVPDSGNGSTARSKARSASFSQQLGKVLHRVIGGRISKSEFPRNLELRPGTKFIDAQRLKDKVVVPNDEEGKAKEETMTPDTKKKRRRSSDLELSNKRRAIRTGYRQSDPSIVSGNSEEELDEDAARANEERNLAIAIAIGRQYGVWIGPRQKKIDKPGVFQVPDDSSDSESGDDGVHEDGGDLDDELDDKVDDDAEQKASEDQKKEVKTEVDDELDAAEEQKEEDLDGIEGPEQGMDLMEGQEMEEEGEEEKDHYGAEDASDDQFKPILGWDDDYLMDVIEEDPANERRLEDDAMQHRVVREEYEEEDYDMDFEDGSFGLEDQ